MHTVIRAPPLPVTAQHAALYLTHLRQKKVRSSTMRSHMSAISFFHRLHGVHGPSGSFLVSKLLISYAKQDTPSFHRGPITLSVLGEIVSQLKWVTSSKYDHLLYYSVFTLMYHAALRISEVCVMPSSNHTLQAMHISLVRMSHKTHLRVSFPSYKHSRGTPAPLVVAPCKTGPCAIEAYRKYMHVRGPSKGPAFCKYSGKPLRRTDVVHALEKSLQRAGLVRCMFNTHSFRIGKATDMAKDGSSHAQIALAGRWRSNAYLAYIRPSVILC